MARSEELELVAQISSRFANLAPTAIDREIQTALQRIAHFFDVDRCALFKVDAVRQNAELSHQAHESHETPLLPHLSKSLLPWLYSAVAERGETVTIPSLAELAPGAARDVRSLRLNGVRAALLVPASPSLPIGYLLALVSSREDHDWTPACGELLRLLSRILGGTIERTSLDHEQLQALRFEHSLAASLSGFARVDPDRLDQQVQTTLEDLRAFAELDQFGMFTVDQDAGWVHLMHAAHAEGIPPMPPACDFLRAAPWLYDRLVRRMEFFSFARVVEFPPEATVDREFVELRGTRSGLYIPLLLEGKVRYMLAVGTRHRERSWPAQFIERLKMLGDVIVAATRQAQDTRERTLVRRQLSWTQQISQSIVNALQACLCVVDASGTVVQVSDSWQAFAWDGGWYPLKVGDDFFQATAATPGANAAQALQVADALRAVMAQTQAERALELAFDGPAGNRHFRTKVRHFEVDGSAYAAILHEDITEKKASDTELQTLRTRHWHSERVTRTGLLIGSLSHELSQPLTAILSNAQAGLRFLAHDTPDLHEIRDIFRDIAADDKRACEIIESLRVMLRRGQGKRRLVDLADLTRECMALLKSELVANQVKLECDFETGCTALIDRAPIQQVVLNLSMNAMEAMASKPPDNRLLRVGVRRREPGEILISVRDSGVGITSDKFTTVFDAFWTTKSRGTGLGLSISRSIIESHGGRIWVDSRYGEGATFFVSLPAAAATTLATDSQSEP